MSPLVFDLALKLDPASLAGGWRILHAYGSPNPQDSALSEDGTVMKVRRLGAGGQEAAADKTHVIIKHHSSETLSGMERWGTGSQELPTPCAPPQIHTLFPSPKTEEGVKGGVLLLRMKPPPAGAGAPAPLALTVTYRDRTGTPFSSRKDVPLPDWVQAGTGAGAPAAPVYESSGIRKAVALARYVDALQSW